MTRGRGLLAVCGTLALLAASQLPYYRVWTMGASFSYDAFTTFSPWFVTLQRDMLAGRNLFTIYQEMFPGLVQPSYLLGNVIRQVLAFVVDNTFLAHTRIQALHAILTVFTTAMLFRSLGLPIFYAALGGFVFMTSGIHVAVSQHVVRHEAYLYLVTSLLCLRLLIKDYGSSNTRKSVLLWSACVVSLVSLTGWAHEAVHYFLPIAGWVVVHLAKTLPTLDARARRRLVFLLAGMSCAVAICDAPRLLFFFEMSQINKTLIGGYAETGGFSTSWPLYWLALLTPNAAGTNGATTPFRFVDDRTLGYAFAGSLALSCATLVVSNLWHQRAYRQAVGVVALLVVLLGFGFGVGSPVHWLLCKVFPPMGMMRHNSYGTSLAYLVIGYLTARGVHELVTRPSYRALWAGAVPCIVSLLLAAALYLAFPTSKFVGSEREQFLTLTRDLAGLWVMQCGFMLLGLALLHRPWKNLEVDTLAPAVAGVAFSLVIAADLVHPTLDAHFSPRQRPSTSWSRFDGDMGLVNPIGDYLRAGSAARLPWRPLRVLPLGVGWFGNTLPILEVAVVSGSDTQGNRFLEQRLSDQHTLEAPQEFAEEYGIDFFWVANNHPAQATLEANAAFRMVQDVGLLGKVYRFEPAAHRPLAQVEPGRYALSWWSEPAVVVRSDGWFGPRYAIDLTTAGIRDFPAEVSLPLLWLSKFGVRNADGDRLPKVRDPSGRLAVRVSSQKDLRLDVMYPSVAYAGAMRVAVALYSAIALSLIVALASELWRAASNRFPVVSS